MDDVDWDTLFDALGDVHRRRILVALLDHNPQQIPVQVPEDVCVGERKLEPLQLEMIHHHLPLLADAGYVTWDREKHQVEKGPAYSEIRPTLELLTEHHKELPGDFV